METKYDWSEVPPEINWIVTGFHSKAKIGFINKPLKDEAMLCWCSRWLNGERVKLSEVSEFKGDWKDSLEQRPVKDPLMDNYKIKVNEINSKEVQELFFKLGYGFFSGKIKAAEEFEFTGEFYFFAYGSDCDLTVSKDHNLFLAKNDFQELTLPQLRDLVVLKRNDVKDATHRDKRDETIYLTSDMGIYYWQGEWCKSAINKSNDYENYIANSLTPINQPQDPALISGADALRALADGKSVDVHESTYKNEVWFNLKDTKFTPAEILAEKVRDKPYKLTFRLKPQTIKLELELPNPFEPKEGEKYYYLKAGNSWGFGGGEWGDDSMQEKFIQFGAWRTEAEVKQVVEQLRKIRGAS